MSSPRVMLITGASKGLGRFLAKRYASSGWSVVGCSRGPSDLEVSGYRHHLVDVTQEADVRRMIGTIRGEQGGLDALINNAGVAAMNHALLTPMESVRRILETNVTGTFLLSRESARLLRDAPQGHARIVNLTTVAVPLALEGEAVYAASKAAVEMLTRVLARELAPLRITCNAVGPTPIETDLIRNVPRTKIDRLVATQPIPRLGVPEDVAHVIDFFLSPDSDFVTGQVLYLGGVS